MQYSKDDNRFCSLTSVLPLCDNWKIYSIPPATDKIPTELSDNSNYLEAVVPGTVAMAKGYQLESPASSFEDLDAKDWIYQTSFNRPSESNSQNRFVLNFEGLSTLCEIWLNNELLESTDNMFREYSIDVTDKLKSTNLLQLRFRSIEHQLSSSRLARPKWKTKLAENHQLRWIRTTPLGHVKVWTPPIKCVGPWRNVTLEEHTILIEKQLSLHTNFKDGKGSISISGVWELLSTDTKPQSIEITVDGKSYPLSFDLTGSTITLEQQISEIGVEAWWPHTHGEQPLYSCSLVVTTEEKQLSLDFGKVGFKSVNFDKTSSTFFINDQIIFCRGVCWTISDYLSFNASKESLTRQLSMLKDAGVNMIRVGGTMVYESDDFYQICDALGIMVWQDFMFASMDYPVEDEAFLANIIEEARQQVSRLAKHTCVSVYCGNTDIKAQAAMFGLDQSLWSNEFFEQLLPELCNKLHPDLPYFASSPEGGVLPFHLSEGITHYWGIGAYKRPLGDANIMRVRFASEGMGHSHIANNQSTQQWLGKSAQPVFDQDWLSRIPKDLGAGWDFEQIRDDYISQLFNCDAVYLRRTNPEKYLHAARACTGEIMAQVFRRWRSEKSFCQGGLTWFARDFWPCAGFGLIDSYDRAKPALNILKRIWSPVTVSVTSEGLDGCLVTLFNEKPNAFSGKLKVKLENFNGALVSEKTVDISLSGGEIRSFYAEELLGAFFDTGYHYQFGEPSFDVLSANLIDDDENSIATDFHFCCGQSLMSASEANITLKVEAIKGADEEQTYRLDLESDRFLQYISLEAKDLDFSDNFFHLSANTPKTVTLKRVVSSEKPLRGQLSALNINGSVRFKC